MSSLDKTLANSYYEIEIDPKTQLPVAINMLVLTGTRGATETKGKRIVGGKHVAFHFKYRLDDFGQVEKVQVPPEAQKILAKN